MKILSIFFFLCDGWVLTVNVTIPAITVCQQRRGLSSWLACGMSVGGYLHYVLRGGKNCQL